MPDAARRNRLERAPSKRWLAPFRQRCLAPFVRLLFALTMAGLIWTDGALSGQSSPAGFVATTKNGEWPHYTGDMRGTRYSPLDQINAAQLQQARSRVAVQDRQPRPAPRVQARRHAADGQRRALHDRRHAPRGRRARRGDRRADLGRTAIREGARGAVAPRQLSGRGARVLDRRPRRRTHPLRDDRAIASSRSTRRPARRSRRSAPTASSI